MKIRDKNDVTKDLMEHIYRKSFKDKSRFWRAVVRALNRPRRRRFEVNLVKLEKYAKSGETVIVPGVVLGNGNVRKKITVAALKFSRTAKEKIEKSGGKCLSIEELFEKNPKGRGVRIMG